MFILVNHSTEIGIREVGRYGTHKEAAEEIANEIISCYNIDLDVDDFVKEDPPCFYYDDGDVYVGFDRCECYCISDGMEDSWIIITV